MINNVVLVGRLTKDIELRYTQTGIAVARFTLAVNRAFSNQQGEKEADFISCIAWRKQAENLANYMRKGNQIGVVGRIQTGSYDDKDGKRVYTTEVVADAIQFLEAKTAGPSPTAPQNNANVPPKNNYVAPQQQQSYQQPQQNTQQRVANTFNDGRVDMTDDDLPF